MGKRVHVAERYDVKWGSMGAFNWKNQEFYALLNALGAAVYSEDTEFEACVDAEVAKGDFYDAIENLKVYIQSPNVYEQEDREAIAAAIKKCEMTPEELLKTMQQFYDAADKRDGFLHFASF